MSLGTGDNVGIGGFIVAGTQPKKVIVRAIGPSLPLPEKLVNPTLGLYGPGGLLIMMNDSWRNSQQAEIMATGLEPTNDLESAIVATLPASPAGIGYTAIVSGMNNTTGLGLVEVYDLDSAADSKLANISTRGQVLTDDGVMIGGVIVVGPSPQKVIVRAIGPSLGKVGVAGGRCRIRASNCMTAMAVSSRPMTIGATRRKERSSQPVCSRQTTLNPRSSQPCRQAQAALAAQQL